MIPEKYYTPTGEEISPQKLVSDMIRNYQNHETKITDFSEGSEIRNLLESIGLTEYKLDYFTNKQHNQSFLIYADGGYLDLHGADLQCPRKQGKQAHGFVTVSLTEALDHDYTISPQTVFVNPETNIKYNVYVAFNYDVDYIIPAGELSVEVPVICSLVGKIGNCERDKVTAFANSTETVLSVTNVNPIADGIEPESDADYRRRLLDKKAGGNFGQKGWYENLLMSIDGVHDISLDYAEETVRVWVNGNTKPISSNILIEALSLLEMEENHLLGHNFRVYEPDYNLINLRVTINSDDTLLDETVRNRLLCFFDGGVSEEAYFHGLSLGESVTENALISAITSLKGVTSALFEVQDNQGVYNRFSEIQHQYFEVGFLNHLEIVFR